MKHELKIPNYTPPLLNELMGHPMLAHQLKRECADMVAVYRVVCDVPKAEGKRRISLRLSGWPRSKFPDPDGCLKAILDALTLSGLLIDDKQQWCELGDVQFVRSRDRETVVILEDL